MEKSMIRLRMSAHDAHYGGNLVDGARMLQLFGMSRQNCLSSMMEMKVYLRDMIISNSWHLFLPEIILRLPEKL